MFQNSYICQTNKSLRSINQNNVAILLQRSRGDRKHKREHSTGSSILSEENSILSLENEDLENDNFGNTSWVIKTSKIMGR